MVVLWWWCLLLAGTWAAVVADILVYESKSDRRSIEAEFKDLSAAFGGTIPIQGVRALVVASADPYGCTKIDPPPWNTSESAMGWAILISQGICSFERKVRLAQAAFYDIAIVHSYNSSMLIRMDTDNPEGITIPSVFIGFAAGHSLRENYLYTEGRFYIIVDDDESPFDLLHILGPLSAVVVICFLTMLGFMLVKYIKDRRRAQRHLMPNSSLKKIPTTKFRRKTDPYETCAICLEDFTEGEKLRVLPCSHAYHSKCIDPWLTCNRRVCPMCKRRVFAANERVTSDSDSSLDYDDRSPLLQDNTRTTSGGTFSVPPPPLQARPQREAVWLTRENVPPSQSSSSSSSPRSVDINSLLSFESTVAPSNVQNAIPVVVTLNPGNATVQENERENAPGQRTVTTQWCTTS